MCAHTSISGVDAVMTTLGRLADMGNYSYPR